MLTEDSRRGFLKRLRKPTLDYVQKHNIFKAVHAEAKKCSLCPYCKTFNGTVKKVGAMKLEHFRYKPKPVVSRDLGEDIKRTFDEAVKDDSSLTSFLGRVQDPLDPFKVLTLFQRISDEVSGIFLF